MPNKNETVKWWQLEQFAEDSKEYTQKKIDEAEPEIRHYKTWAEYESDKDNVPAEALFIVDEDNPENKIPKHNLLEGRDEANAHPYTAIEGLQAQLDKKTDVAKTQTLESRMNQFAQLPSGSTAGDAELADIRVGADGKTYENAGEAVRGQVTSLKETIKENVDDLKNEIDLININDLSSQSTPYTISSSGIWTGSSNTTHVTIRVKRGDTLRLKANRKNNTIYAMLKNNIINDSHMANFSSEPEWSQRKTLAANSETEDIVIPDDVTCVYFTVNANNTNYLPQSIKINGIEQNYIVRKKIDEILPLIDDLSLSSFRYKYQLDDSDNIDENLDAGYYAISSSMPHPAGTFPSGFLGQRLMLMNCPTKNRYTQSIVNAKGVVAVRVFSSGTWSNWNVIGEKLNIDNTLPYEYKHTANNDTMQNAGKNITVLSYNVGVYSNGNTASKGMPSEIIDSKMFELKKFIMSVGAELVGLQEDTTYVDKEQTKNAHQYLYKPIYPFRYSLGGTSVYSKGIMQDGGGRTIGNDRYMAWCEKMIDNKILLFVSVHPSVDTSSHRETEYNDLFNFIKGRQWEWCIITGDFNSLEVSDRARLDSLCADNNFKMANGGYLGWLITTPENESIDNIIVSEKCVINDIVVHSSDYSKLYSDHYPLSARITLLNQ